MFKCSAVCTGKNSAVIQVISKQPDWELENRQLEDLNKQLFVLDKRYHINDANKTQCGNLNLNIATINCESCNNKAAMIADYILEQDLDICCLTETWLNADDPVTINEWLP